MANTEDRSTNLEDFMRTTGRAFAFVPQTAEYEDRSWTARYSGAEWDVSGASEQSARDQLGLELRKRMHGAVDDDWQTAALREHFAEGLIAGVDELDAETTARIHNPPNFDGTAGGVGRS